jgi:hypothetical protein
VSRQIVDRNADLFRLVVAEVFHPAACVSFEHPVQNAAAFFGNQFLREILDFV